MNFLILGWMDSDYLFAHRKAPLCDGLPLLFSFQFFLLPLEGVKLFRHFSFPKQITTDYSIRIQLKFPSQETSTT
jgi:hypothetical protein